MRQPFLTISQVAKVLRRTPARVYQMVANAEIPATKVAGRIVVPQAALEKWVEEKAAAALAAVRSAGPGMPSRRF